MSGPAVWTPRFWAGLKLPGAVVDAEEFREQLARLVSQLLKEAPDDEPDELVAAIEEHLGPGASALPIHTENLPDFELQVHYRLLPDLKLNAVAHGSSKPGSGRRHLLGAKRQTEYLVSAFVVGDSGSGGSALEAAVQIRSPRHRWTCACRCRPQGPRGGRRSRCAGRSEPGAPRAGRGSRRRRAPPCAAGAS